MKVAILGSGFGLTGSTFYKAGRGRDAGLSPSASKGVDG